jgi:DNA-binding NtrC family response regulator
VAPQPGVLPLFDSAGEIRPLDEIEAEVIRFAINHYRGQMSEVARRLHIGRSTLYRKLENLGLDGEKPGPEGEPVAAG